MKANQSDSENWEDLLITKLSVPLLSSDIIHRDRLTNRLQTSVNQPIILLVAPTGYGKTTLLAEWFSSLPADHRQVIWLNLDPFDNTPIQFWSYIILGFQQACPNFKYRRQQFLPYGLRPDNVSLLNPLLNEIARISHPVYLVLDDYQVIQDEAIHRGLEYLINHQPANLHIIIASRVTPPLRLSLQQAQRRMIELNALDLSFTYPETTAYLSHVMGLNINLNQLEQLHQATKGWIAGLQLAALSLKNKRISESDWTVFPENLREIKNYLIEEVLSHQDTAICDFLMRTSILSEFCPDLCDTVLDQTNSLEMLQQIEQANLFITAIDRDRQWHRYHPLFAEALQTQLKRKYPDQISTLHRRAYTWLRANGYSEKAISHALIAGDGPIVADILEESALNAIVQNDLVTLAYWTQRFTPPLLQEHPQLGVYDALAHYFLGRSDQVDPKLRVVEQILGDQKLAHRSPNEIRLIQWEIAAIQAVMSRRMSSFSEVTDRIQALIQAAPPEDAYFTGFLANALAIQYEENDDLDAALDGFRQSHAFAQIHNLPNPFVHSQCEIAQIFKKKGRLSDAEQAYQIALQSTLTGKAHSGSRILVLTGLLGIAYEQNDLRKTTLLDDEIFSQFDRLDGAIGPLNYQLFVLLHLAKYRMAQGDTQIGNYYFQRAAREIEQTQEFLYHDLLDIYIDVQVCIWIAAREHAKGEQWLKSRIRWLQEDGKTSAIAETTGLARIHLAQGKPKLALSLLTHLLPVARRKGVEERLIEINLLQALAFWTMNEKNQAYRALKRAVALGKPEGYIRIFVNEGEPMKALISAYLADVQSKSARTENTANEIQYLLYVKDAFPEAAPKAIPASAEIKTILAVKSSLPEPLSLRETEVLTMLLSGKSVKEIAASLAITPNTARAHIRGIHRKMDVHSRIGVYQRAKELNLIT